MDVPKLKLIPKKYTGETAVVSMRIPKDMLKDIDAVASETGRTRNELVSTALEFALQHMEIVDDEPKGKLYERANKLRLNCEFDKAQDLGKVGATQDLLRGIDKLMGKTEKDSVVQTQSVVQQVMPGGPNVDALLRRGYDSLEDRAFDEAKAFFNDALNSNAESADAYLGLFMVEVTASVRKTAQEKYVAGDYTDNRYWKRAKQYATGELANSLREWDDERNQRLEREAERKAREKAEAEKKKQDEINGLKKAAYDAISIVGNYVYIRKIVKERIIRKKISEITGLDFSGDVVFFGSYEQGKGKAPIEWRVLERSDKGILLLSRYALDCQQYNTTFTPITWEECTLRKWLNGTFINDAFSPEEQALIGTTTVTADKNPKYSTDPGNDTQDKIFLLSITEAENYFSSDSARKCEATAYANAQGAYTNTSDGNCWWWLRSPGDNSFGAASVYYDGGVYYFGGSAYIGRHAVRPALWINLES